MLGEPLILVPSVAFFVCTGIFTAILVGPSRDRGRREFLWLIAAVAAWNATDIVGFLEISRGVEMSVLRGASVLWISLGLLAFRLSCALTGHSSPKLALLFTVLFLVAAIGSTTTPLVVAGFSRRPWGLLGVPGPLHALASVAPMSAAIFAIVRFWVPEETVGTARTRKAMRLLSVGLGSVLVAAMTAGVVLPDFVGRPDLPRFTATWLTAFCAFVARAIYRHDLLGFAMTRLIEDLFRRSDDGLIIADASREIIRSNAAASRLLGTGDILLGRNLDDLLKNAGSTTSDGLLEVDKKGRFLEIASSSLSAPREVGTAILLRDVTDKRNKETHLRASRDQLFEAERLLRDILNSLPLGIHGYRLEGDGRLVFERSNRAAERILGIDHSHFEGLPIEDAFPGLRTTDLPDRYRKVAISREPWSSEDIRYQDDHIAGAFDVHAFCTGENRMVATFRDITDQKRAEMTLKESEERFRTTFEQAAVGLLHVALDGTFLRVNKRFCDILGYSRDELIERDLFSVTDPQDVSVGRDQFQRLMLQQIETFAVEKRLRTKSSSTVWVNLTASFHRGSSDRASYFIIVIEDITERKAAEASLVRLSSAVENSPNPILITEPSGAIAYVNAAFMQTSGFTWTEVIGRPLEAFSVGAGDPSEAPAISTALRDGKEWRGELSCLMSDGGHYPAIVSVAPVSSFDGKPCNFVVVQQDMTAYRQMEEQLKETAKMQAIGQLTGGVAHDFNNLLTVIISNVSMLVDAVQDSEARSMALDALSAAQRGGELTSHLLAFSRRQTLKPRVLDLTSSVEQAMKMIRRTLSESIDIEAKLSVDLWNVLCDPGQLESALLNLAINARDAMPRGGTLTFTTENAQVRGPISGSLEPITAGDYVMVAIRDTGQGMSRDVLQRAFEPFFTTKELGRGTGLGLSMVYGFVRQSGGYATIDSAEGKGTSVGLYFPRFDRTGRERERSDIDVAPRDASRGSERILVVEDDPTVRRSTVRALVSLGYEVIEAENGAAALTMLDGGLSIDLLFSDITMPGGMSGFDLATVATHRFPGMTILLTTGYTDLARQEGDGDSDRARRVEMLAKPFGPRELGNAVRQALDRASGRKRGGDETPLKEPPLTQTSAHVAAAHVAAAHETSAHETSAHETSAHEPSQPELASSPPRQLV